MILVNITLFVEEYLNIIIQFNKAFKFKNKFKYKNIFNISFIIEDIIILFQKKIEK